MPARKRAPEAVCRAGFGDKGHDDVYTPRPLFDWLNKKYHFDFDPCPARPSFDGLRVEWGSSNYVNPPYSCIDKWLKKAVTELKKGKRVAMLIPFRPHRKYWWDWVYPHADEVLVPYNGVVFEGYKTPPPFPVALVLMGYAKRQRKQPRFKSRPWAGGSKCIRF